MDNSISFQSRIRFVDHYEFYKTVGRNVLNLKNIVVKNNRQSFPDRGGYFLRLWHISTTRPMRAMINIPNVNSSSYVTYCIGITPFLKGQPFPPDIL